MRVSMAATRSPRLATTGAGVLLAAAMLLAVFESTQAESTIRDFRAYWDPVPGAVDYCLYHDLSPGPPYADRRCVGNTTFAIWRLPIVTGTDYFVVTAVEEAIDIGRQAELPDRTPISYLDVREFEGGTS